MEIVQLIISAINAASIIFLFLQIKEMKEQTESSHDQARREKTVDVMMAWSNSIKKETSFAGKIVEKLTEQQCRELYNQKPFKVNTEIKNMLCDICPNKECESCEKQSGDFVVKGLQLSELRWYVISYLNILETVLVAWQQGVVDQEVILSEFSYLYNQEKGKNALENFRTAANGRRSYPVIDTFCEKLKEESSPKTVIKKPIKLSSVKNKFIKASV